MNNRRSFMRALLGATILAKRLKALPPGDGDTLRRVVPRKEPMLFSGGLDGAITVNLRPVGLLFEPGDIIQLDYNGTQLNYQVISQEIRSDSVFSLGFTLVPYRPIVSVDAVLMDGEEVSISSSCMEATFAASVE